MALSLEVVTPRKQVVYEDSVHSVVIPGTMGQMEVLDGHINVMTTLVPGTFAYQIDPNGEYQWAALSGGYAQILNGKITVLAETLELSQEIDAAKIELKRVELLKKLKEQDSGTEEYRSSQNELKYLDHAGDVIKR